MSRPTDTSQLPLTAAHAPDKTAYAVLLSISFCHLLNDLIQSLFPALYPMLKTNFSLSFTQIGMITLTFQLTASLFQPVVGAYTDKHPQPFSLAAGMLLTLLGLLLLSIAPIYGLIVCAAALVGAGSSIFHPESSRVARMAAGERHGLAQSVFQVGGNFGSALGPLLAAFIVLPYGQGSVAWFSVAALAAMAILVNVGAWYRSHGLQRHARSASRVLALNPKLPPEKVRRAVAILLVLMFSKHLYTACLASYFTFYLMHNFGVSVRDAQLHLFAFLGAAAAGTIIGGPIGDRFGRKYVIWASIFGVLPLTLLLPHMDLFWTGVLAVPIGLIMASAFPAIVVYGQELIPGKVGMISGLFYGFAFGVAGLGAAALGILADHTSITFVYQVCAFLPAIGLLAVFLPNIERPKPLPMETPEPPVAA